MIHIAQALNAITKETDKYPIRMIHIAQALNAITKETDKYPIR